MCVLQLKHRLKGIIFFFSLGRNTTQTWRNMLPKHIIQVARLTIAGGLSLSKAQRSCVGLLTSRYFTSTVRANQNENQPEQSNTKPVVQNKPKSKYTNKLFEQVKSKNLGKQKKEPDVVVFELKKDNGTSIMANTLFTLAAVSIEQQDLNLIATKILFNHLIYLLTLSFFFQSYDIINIILKI